MFRWFQSFINREVVADVPAESDRCLDCGKLDCTEDEYQACAPRRARAAVLTKALSAPQDRVYPFPVAVNGLPRRSTQSDEPAEAGDAAQVPLRRLSK